jgi:hypothetical protein
MTLLRTIVSSLPPVGLLVLQLSCGGDSSGPGHVTTSITANSSTTLMAPLGTDVTELPSVLVSDQSGAPMVGASVTFTVTSGGGSVTGGNATTNPSGIATVGSWTLGATAGQNTLVAASGSLPSVTFSANGFDPCAVATPHTLGSTINGQLALTDCRLSDGSFVDFYSVTIPTSGTFVFDQTSQSFDTYLALLTATGSVIGVNDDFGATGSTDSRLKVIVPAGTYIIGANSFDANVLGNYSLASAASATAVTNCEDVFVLPGISTPQSLSTTDCSTSGFFSDEYVIFLTAGQTITVSMNSTVLDSYLEIRDGGTSAVLVSNDDVDATTKNASVTYTVPVLATPTTGFYIIAAASKVAGATGDYTLAIQ